MNILGNAESEKITYSATLSSPALREIKMYGMVGKGVMCPIMSGV